ncbi:hypothetical protein CEK64_14455 [Xanthomonas sontii]|nr:hypothetical protein CEK64_14455 [Xanthomonas sontii]
MFVLRLLRRNCLEPAPARRSASRHRVEDGHGRKRRRRAALDGENAVIPWRKQQDRPPRPRRLYRASGARRPDQAGSVSDGRP